LTVYGLAFVRRRGRATAAVAAVSELAAQSPDGTSPKPESHDAMQRQRPPRDVAATRRLFATALAASLGLVCTASASAQEALAPAQASPFGDCVGLTCVPAGQPYAVAEASGMPVAHLSGPRQLPSQKRAGFYKYDVPSLGLSDIVAYVVPPGRLSEAPASVQALPVVAAWDSRLFTSGTVIIFGPEIAAYEPQGATAARRLGRNHRPTARAAAYEDCAGGYFCVWDFTTYSGPFAGWGNTFGNWLNLGAVGWGNRASSYRNARSTDALLSIYNDGQHPRQCYDSYTASATLSGGFNNNTSSLFVSGSDGRC
jgi:peptidase inhibitor family I36